MSRNYSLDSLAEWFLRLNGFFTILNFVVHPVRTSEGSQQRTDADVLAIRFPDRREIIGETQVADHPSFLSARPHLVIAEVKKGRCQLNGPWTRAESENVNHILRSLGCVSKDLIQRASEQLSEKGRYQGDDIDVTLLCFGSRKSSTLAAEVGQYTWVEVVNFVYDRYQTLWRLKRQNQQWPPIGRLLWDRCEGRERDEYVRDILGAFELDVSRLTDEVAAPGKWQGATAIE